MIQYACVPNTSRNTAGAESGPSGPSVSAAEGSEPVSRHDDEVTERLRALLERFGFRPLSTRSQLLSLLLGTHPPEMSVERLVAFGDIVGIRPGTVRTTLSRMVAAGDLATDDARYRLSDRLLARQRQQDLDRTDAVTPDRPDASVPAWTGGWWTAVVVADDRSMTERRRFRSSMVGARMGELRPDIWMRPDNLAPPTAEGVIVTRGPLVQGDPRRLVDELWDVATLESSATELAGAFDELREVFVADPRRRLPIAFDVSAVVVNFLRREPRLPVELVDLSACSALRSAYADFNVTFLDELSVMLGGDRASLRRSP